VSVNIYNSKTLENNVGLPTLGKLWHKLLYINKTYTYVCVRVYVYIIYAYIHIYFFCSTGGLTHGLEFERKAFYHLSHSTSPLCIDHFWDRVSLCALTWTSILLYVLPGRAGITVALHHAQPLVEMGSCKLFAWAGLKPWSSLSWPPK
jgi:hypothetical protein